MTQFLTCVKSYTVLFLLMMLLIQLVPKENYRKYIQVFMGMLLVFALLSPVIKFLFDSEEFYELVEYETFQEQLEELKKDTNRVEFLQQDYYEEEGENNRITSVVKEKEEEMIKIEPVSIGTEGEKTGELEEGRK